MTSIQMTPMSWWASPAFRDDREGFNVRVSIEGARMQRDDKRARPYVTALGDRGDYWKAPKAVAYHDEAA